MFYSVLPDIICDMRILLSLVSLIILLFSGFMFLMIGIGGGSASCVTNPDYCSNVEIYKWAAIAMFLASLTGLIGMAKVINIRDGSQTFAIFAMIGILIPALIYFFLGQFVGSI